MSFNKWKDEYGLEFEPNYSKETELDCKAAFKAGQQSKQAEIDNLKKSFGVCCSSARDISDAYYQGRFVLVNERDLERFL